MVDPNGIPEPGTSSPRPDIRSRRDSQTAQLRDHGSGTLILVLGVLSLVVCAPLGPVAWYLGNRAIDEMSRQQEVTWSNRGLIRAGRACGIASSGILGFLFLGAAIIALIASFG